MQHVMSTRNVNTKPLLIGRMRQVRATLPVREVGASRREIEAALAAVADRRSDSERTIDHVVDRLLKELTW